MSATAISNQINERTFYTLIANKLGSCEAYNQFFLILESQLSRYIFVSPQYLVNQNTRKDCH